MHQFVPLDVPRYIRRFLDHWQPDLALIAESEIWPNMIMALDQRHIPLVLVNGRVSDRSFQRWQKVPRIIGALLERFALCLAQTPDDAERLARLGAPRVVMTGNLKFDAPPPPADPRVVAQVLAIARQTMRIMRQNLFWAFIYNVIGIPIAAGALYPAFRVLLSPILASAAMALSSVSVVSNSLRLRRHQPGL